MKKIAFALLLLVACCGSNSVMAQATVDKLLGCWKLKSISFSEPNKDSVEIRQSVGFHICFEKNGSFSAQSPKGESMGKGTYAISADGKTLEQHMHDNEPGNTDLPATIITLNDKELALQAEEVTMHFERIAVPAKKKS